jgi:hypothetical protein
MYACTLYLSSCVCMSFCESWVYVFFMYVYFLYVYLYIHGFVLVYTSLGVTYVHMDVCMRRHKQMRHVTTYLAHHTFVHTHMHTYTRNTSARRPHLANVPPHIPFAHQLTRASMQSLPLTKPSTLAVAVDAPHQRSSASVPVRSTSLPQNNALHHCHVHGSMYIVHTYTHTPTFMFTVFCLYILLIGFPSFPPCPLMHCNSLAHVICDLSASLYTHMHTWMAVFIRCMVNA